MELAGDRMKLRGIAWLPSALTLLVRRLACSPEIAKEEKFARAASGVENE